MNSSGNTTRVKADPYFLLRARMIFDIKRSRKINSSIGKWSAFLYSKFWEGRGRGSLIWPSFKFPANHTLVQ